jgi:transposase
MPYPSKKAKLSLTESEREELSVAARSRTMSARRVERARVLLAYADGARVAAIAREHGVRRDKADRIIERALAFGPVASLKDMPRRGRPSVIGPDAQAWVISLACQEPKDLGYPHELWTTRLLADHVRRHCGAAGHPQLGRTDSGAVTRLLKKHELRPHKIRYYLERRDPDFDVKMVNVLCVYDEVDLIRTGGKDAAGCVAVSYDEKPGIQAIATTAPDLPPVPGKHPTIARDHEYVRLGTMTLMAAINLLTGVVHGQVVDRHRSSEFIDFLKLLDDTYADAVRIRVVLDNHSAHISKETKAFLATRPGRFEFIFTPKHGSWLNLIENFFSKMTRSVLREIRVASREELRTRILAYLDMVNAMPVPFRWTWGLEELREV